MICHFILYVRDQELSRRFYESVLGIEPAIHVPGMTEFRLSDGCKLGLMPEKNIKKLLGSNIEDPEKTNGVARAELYLLVDNPAAYMARAEVAGARCLSRLENRNWGDQAGYVADPNGHVLAFAKSL